MTADLCADLWQRGCQRLAAELPEQQFNTWIRPLPAADVVDGEDTAVVSVRVPNRFKLDWIRTQYASRIESVLGDLAGKPVRLELLLAAREPAAALHRPSAAVATVSGPGPVAAAAALQAAMQGAALADPGGAHAGAHAGAGGSSQPGSAAANVISLPARQASAAVSS